MSLLRRSIWPSPVWLVAIVVTALAAGLHCYFLSHAGAFWRDEVNLINLSSRSSLGEMQKDSFPLLLPLLIHGWLGLGLGEASLRWFGLFVGCGVMAALGWCSWKINRTPPLLGLVLFGLNSTLIVFGDSLRAYGLGCLFIVLVVFCGADLLKRPGRIRAVWLAVASVLSVQTLYHNAILVAAVCFGAMLVCIRRKNWRGVGQIFAAGTVAAMSLLVYVPNFIAGREGAATLRAGLNWSRLTEGFGDAFGFPATQYIWIWVILIVGLLICGWRAFGRESLKAGDSTAEICQNDLTLFAAATVLASFVGFLVFLWLAAFPSQSWYLLPLMAVVVACLDFLWPACHQRLRLPLLVLVVATGILAVPANLRVLDYRFTNVDVWTRQMKTSITPGDYMVVMPWFCGITFDHYLKNPVAWDTLPPIADHSIHRFDLVKAQLQNTNAIKPVMENIAQTLQSGHQVWVLAMKGWMDVPEPGTTAPASLPPAPQARWGWSEFPYTTVWVSQVAHFVGDHSLQFGRVKNPGASGRFIEDTELFLATGWRGSTNPPSVK